MERIVVLGLGNILYGDEGFGVRVAERLYSRYAFPDNVEIVDAGTQGHPLLAFVERATRLLLLDAVDFGLQPGTTVEKDSTGIPAYLSAHKMSLHQ
ncbi:hydrogenase maturation protease, partial [Bilophila wadsworthia]